MSIPMKQEQTHRHTGQTCGFQVGRGMEWEFGASKCKLLYVEWVSDKFYRRAQETI